MEKVKNKILISIFIILCLVGTFIGLYNVYAENSITVGSRTIKDDYDLAEWARNSTQNDNESFVDADLNRFIDEYIGLHVSGQGGHGATIGLSSAACMFHSQSGSQDGKYKIAHVIDFVGTSATIYRSKGDSGTNIKGSEMNGALLYAMNKAANGSDEITTTWKSAFKRLFFEHSKLLSQLDSVFKNDDPNNDASNSSIAEKMAEAKEEGKKMGDPTKEPEKAATEPTQNAKKYLGPFKLKTLGGYEPTKLKLTVGSKDSNIDEVWIKKDGEYSKIDVEKIKEDQNFYIKCDAIGSEKWKVELKFESTGFRGRLVLIREQTGGGQNLAIYGAPLSSKLPDSVKWSGER